MNDTPPYTYEDMAASLDFSEKVDLKLAYVEAAGYTPEQMADLRRRAVNHGLAAATAKGIPPPSAELTALIEKWVAGEITTTAVTTQVVQSLLADEDGTG